MNRVIDVRMVLGQVQYLVWYGCPGGQMPYDHGHAIHKEPLEWLRWQTGPEPLQRERCPTCGCHPVSEADALDPQVENKMVDACKHDHEEQARTEANTPTGEPGVVFMLRLEQEGRATLPDPARAAQ